jgi:hypothetical protein
MVEVPKPVMVPIPLARTVNSAIYTISILCFLNSKLQYLIFLLKMKKHN